MSEITDPRFPDEPKLGDLLREARESRDLDLSDVAGLTNVRRDYLTALEEGRYNDLPEDVYTKNFVRLFSQAVGFDVVRALEIYRSERRDANLFNTSEQRLEYDREQAADVPPLSEGGPWWDSLVPTPRWGALISTVLMVGAVVALALWGFNSTFFNASRPSTTTDPSTTNAGDAGVAPADGRPPTQEESAEQALNTMPRTVRLSVSSVPAGAEVSVDEFPLPGTTPIESAPVTARESRTIRVTHEGYEPAERQFDLTFDRNLSFALTPSGAAAEEGDGAEPGGEPGGEAGGEAGEGPGGEQGVGDPVAQAGDQPGDRVADQAGGATAAQATLTIIEDTWLEVYQGTARNQGQRLAFTTAQAGQTLRFRLPIYVHVGNAGGVELTVAGQERGTLGSSGEVLGLAVTR
ncbi:MAG: RodZ domain-containing protein [Trueperaceae bacterium]